MTHAWCVEDPKSILILYSWDSIQVACPIILSECIVSLTWRVFQAHHDVGAQPEIQEQLKMMQEIIDMHGGPFLHVELIRVE